MTVGELLGYIEYPSHYDHGLDLPVGLAFRATIVNGPLQNPAPANGSKELRDDMHEEQQAFLAKHLAAALTVVG